MSHEPDQIKIPCLRSVIEGNMTCEALVIGSVAGLALTAGVLSFQVLIDRKAAQKEGKRKVTASGIVTKLAQ